MSTLQQQMLFIGTNGVITCLVSEGMRDLEWKTNGHSIAYSNSTITSTVEARYTILDSGSLHISNVTEQDAGIYSCTVSNPAGSDSKTIEVEAVYQVS